MNLKKNRENSSLYSCKDSLIIKIEHTWKIIAKDGIQLVPSSFSISKCRARWFIMWRYSGDTMHEQLPKIEDDDNDGDGDGDGDAFEVIDMGND